MDDDAPITVRAILTACGFEWAWDAPLETVLNLDFGITLDTELTEE